MTLPRPGTKARADLDAAYPPKDPPRLSMTRHAARQTMTCRQFAETFIRIPDQAGVLRPPILYPSLARMIDAIDAVDPATGLRRYSTFNFLTGRKMGKSTLLGIVGLFGLIVDPFGGVDREIILLASDYHQAKAVGFRAAEQFVQRHPFLAKRCRVLSSEIVYLEQVRDPKSGEPYTSESVFRAMPKDPRGTHGHQASIALLDELWTQGPDNVDAATVSAARQSPFTLRTSYLGTKDQKRAGVPIFDAYQQAVSGSNPRAFSIYLHGEQAMYEAPWQTPTWVEDQRQNLITVPSRFQRMILNEWGSGDNTLLTAAELQAAIVDRPEAERGDPGVQVHVRRRLGSQF